MAQNGCCISNAYECQNGQYNFSISNGPFWHLELKSMKKMAYSAYFDSYLNGPFLHQCMIYGVPKYNSGPFKSGKIYKASIHCCALHRCALHRWVTRWVPILGHFGNPHVLVPAFKISLECYFSLFSITWALDEGGIERVKEAKPQINQYRSGEWIIKKCFWSFPF